MKAAFFYGPNQIKVEDTSKPHIADNELLIRIMATSVCGTDLRISNVGHFKIPEGDRRVLGHELAGTIVQAGKQVEGFTEGMRVTATPNIGCGLCEFCRDGYNQMCPDYEAFGISIDGGFQEFMKVPNSAIKGGNIFPIPDQISFEEASLIEPLSCCYNALKALNTAYTDIVLIIGAGPIGAMHTLLSRIAGAKKILVADIRKERLHAIEQFGADVLIDTSRNDLKTAVMQNTAGRGADVVITACSIPEIQSQSIELLATHGRVNFFGGLGQNTKVPMDTNAIHYKGLHVLGTTGQSNSNYAKALSMVAEGRANLQNLVSATFSISDINKAFDYAASGQGMKALIINP